MGPPGATRRPCAGFPQLFTADAGLHATVRSVKLQSLIMVGGEVSGRRKFMVASMLTVLASNNSLLTTASKTDGEYAFNFGTCVLLWEMVSSSARNAHALPWAAG